MFDIGPTIAARPLRRQDVQLGEGRRKMRLLLNNGFVTDDSTLHSQVLLDSSDHEAVVVVIPEAKRPCAAGVPECLKVRWQGDAGVRNGGNV